MGVIELRSTSGIRSCIKKMKPRFLNVDLELITKVDPTHLKKDFGNGITILFSGPGDGDYLTTGEIAEFFEDELSVLQEYERIFSKLSPEGKREWNQAIKREFNFGYETETTPDRVEISFSEEVLASLKRLDGSFGITVYNNEN